MNPMKRLGLAALLAVGLTLLASTPARAKKPGGEIGGDTWGPIELTNVGDEPQASGKATLTEVVLVDVYDSGLVHWQCYTGRLSVQCRHLTAGATYSIGTGWFLPAPMWTVTANSAGKVETSEDVYFEIGYSPTWEWPFDWVLSFPCQVGVFRLEPDGSSTKVLAGELRPPSPWDR